MWERFLSRFVILGWAFALFFKLCIINNIGTKMKLKNMNEFVRSTAVRSRGPRQTYNLGFSDETRGFALEVSCGRMIEKSNRRKIFYQLYI